MQTQRTLKIALVDYENSPHISALYFEAQKLSSAEASILFFQLTGDEDTLPFFYMESLLTLFEEELPDFLLFPHTDYGCELASRLAYEKQISSLTDIRQMEQLKDETMLYKHICNMNLTGVFSTENTPCCLTIADREGDLEDRSKSDFAKILPICFGESDEAAYRPAASEPFVEENHLPHAKLILACGRGLNKKEEILRLQETAHILGGEVGCSRPVFMDGRLGAQHLIGMSGHLCAPWLCLTIGVSGAAAFLIGIQESKKIIAVNSDETAPIFSNCDIGIVGDGSLILQELQQQLEDIEHDRME
ncbi:MAG: electron transfer flavoprotein subunit alpha/FixB family protein [Lachnospiraceae bacterium]|nr:electron transfer flavoprotein subunit alpha/FixB family protein [Lachnospiraceae bacterium]